MLSVKKIVWLFLLIGVVFLADAQEMLSPIRDFCRPGVLHKSPSKGLVIEYGYFPGYRLSSNEVGTDDRVVVNHHLLVKYKIPILNKEKVKFLLGARHFREAYHLRNADGQNEWLSENLDGKRLKGSRFSAYLTQSFGYNHYLGLKAEVSLNGDYNNFVNFKKRYRESHFIGAFGFKKTEYRELAVGLAARTGYRGFAVFPFLLYNHTFNEHWGIESTLPVKVMLRYRLNNRQLFLFGGEYASRNYSLSMLKGQTDLQGRYRINSPEAQINLTYQQQLGDWIWMELKTGWVTYFRSRVRSIQTDADQSFRLSKTDSGFLKVGLFISPPERLIR